MGATRSFGAGRFVVDLDGFPCVVKDVDGGNFKAEVTTTKMGPTLNDMKGISTVKIEPITLNIGMAMGKSMADWMKATLDLAYMRKSGHIAAVDHNGKVKGFRHFRDALITEIGIPALDASNKEPAYFTIKFDPDMLEHAKGDDSAVSSELNTAQKKWLCSNFRLRMGDLDCTKVNKIDALTIKQGIVQDDVGEERVSLKEPTKLEIPNMKITLSAVTVASWQDWFRTFVVAGENGQEKELNGAIEFLDPSLKTTLGTVDLFQCGIFALNEEKKEAGKDGIARWVAEVYVERMAITIN
jgi:hypothetical protein